MNSLDKALATLEAVDADFKAVVAIGQPNDALTATMQSVAAPKINAVTADTAALRTRHTTLTQIARYLELASNSAGVPCPKSAKGANAELRVAQKVVAGRNAEVAGSGPRILTRTRADASGDVDFERFEGFVCGNRSAENQFEGTPRLCGQFRFVVERQKPGGASNREFSDWSLKSFEESDSSGGVDCALKKK